MSERDPASACADEAVILGYVYGGLDAARRSQVQAHLLACDRCREWVAAVAAELHLASGGDVVAGAGGHEPIALTGVARAAAIADDSGRYTGIRFLGKGAMGEVYRAYDTWLGREVALKFVTNEASTARARLVREARAAARISHPNVVAVHDVGVIDGELFIAMELVEGTTLSEWLATPRSGPEIVETFVQAGRALEAAHAAGVLHRDFKPHNVLVSQGNRVRVGDFGLARLVEEGAGATGPVEPSGPRGGDLTITGTVAGTPAYMAPEQERGEPVDARADQFSYSVALYEAITGRHPFWDDAAQSELGHRELRRFPPTCEGLPAGVMEVAVRGLAIEPGDRFGSMTELLAALESTGSPATADKPAAGIHRWWLVLPIAAALIAAGGIVWWVSHDRASGGESGAALAVAPSDDARPRVDQIVRLTSETGCEEYPAFARDGRTVYYDGEVDGDNEIFAVDPVTRERRRLSSEPGVDMLPRVSPDGRRLAWGHGEPRHKQLRVLRLDVPDARPASAGAIESGWIDWASNDEILAPRLDGSLELVEIDAGGARRAVHPGGRGADGVRTYAVRQMREDSWLLGGQFEGDSRLYAGVLGGPWQQVELHDWTFTADSGLAIGASRNAAYFVGRLPNDTRALLRWSAGSSRVDALSLPNPGFGLDVSADGARLAYTTCLMRSWIALLDGSGREPERVVSSLEWDAQTPVALDADRLLVTSDRDSGLAVWLYDVKTGRGRSISPPTAFMPAASRDGRQVAYLSHPEETAGGLFLVDIETMKSRQLTENPSDRSPMFGHDGKTIYLIRNDGGLRVVEVAISDGAVTNASGLGVAAFAASPVDDRLIVVMEGQGDRPVMVQRSGGPPRRLAQLPGGYYEGPSISADGKKLLIVRGQTELLELELDGRSPPRALFSAPKTAIVRNPAYRPGGGVYVEISAAEGDLMLVNGQFP